MSLFRKVIQISAQQSPNVLYAVERIKAGEYPPHELLVEDGERDGFFTREEYEKLAEKWERSGKEPCELPIVTPGVVTYPDYLRRTNNWNAMTRTIRLFGRFYEGAEAKLYPELWLRRAMAVAHNWDVMQVKRIAEAMGVDPAEGGDETAWTIVDSKGIIYQEAEQTPDTAEIPGKTLHLMRKYKLRPEQIFFDPGGGGKQISDALRRQGYNVQMVPFGTVKQQDPYRYGVPTREKKELDEDKFIYKSRRAQMYGELRELIDPKYINKRATAPGFGIPESCDELIRQLRPIPYLLDGEGRLYLPPKRKNKPNSNEITLEEIIGRSPDHADSLVLAVYGMQNKVTKRTIGVH